MSPPGVQPHLLRMTTVAPAAGQEWSKTVPAGKWWRIISGHGMFTTSGDAGTRWPGFTLFDDAANRLVAVTGPVSGVSALGLQQILAYTKCYTFDSAGAFNIANIVGTIEISNTILCPGWVFGSSTPNIKPGDQYSAMEFLVLQWEAEPMYDGNTVQSS